MNFKGYKEMAMRDDMFNATAWVCVEFHILKTAPSQDHSEVLCWDIRNAYWNHKANCCTGGIGSFNDNTQFPYGHNDLEPQNLIRLQLQLQHNQFMTIPIRSCHKKGQRCVWISFPALLTDKLGSFLPKCAAMSFSRCRTQNATCTANKTYLKTGGINK